MTVSNLPLESLIRMVVSSQHAVDGLQAMAAEIGGREGRKVAQLAETLRRGGNIDAQIAHVPWAITTLQAAGSQLDTTRPEVTGTQLPRWLMLKDQRIETKKALNRTVWFSLGYGLLALIVGLVCLRFAASLYSYFDFDFSWPKKPTRSLTDELQRVHIVYLGLISINALLILLWLARAECWSGIARRSKSLNFLCKLVASFWNRVPLVGSTIQAIDLAEMCESISLSLSCGWTFPDACRWTAKQTRSPGMRAWLEKAAPMLERGESFAATLKHSPCRPSWLPVMINLYSVEQTNVSLAERWRSLSDKLHSLMSRRRRRTTVCLPPISNRLFIIDVFTWLVIRNENDF